jgi:hypothetical protein
VFHFHYISRAVTARWDGSLCSAREANGFPKVSQHPGAKNGKDSGCWRDPARQRRLKGEWKQRGSD